MNTIPDPALRDTATRRKADYKTGKREDLANLSLAAEIERDLIAQRAKEALKARKVMGMKLGRPGGPGKSKLDKHKDEIIALLRNGSTKRFVAQKYETTVPNLYNWVIKNNCDVKPIV